MSALRMVVIFFRALLRTQTDLAAENLALRHQLAVLEHSAMRPKLRKRDRIFWVWLSRLWPSWRSVLLIVQPETVVRWHKLGFKLYWRWKSRSKNSGRPKIDAEIRKLIRQMCTENLGWGSPRIQSELALLGFTVAKSTVERYMVRNRKPPSQTWRAFLDHHLTDIAAIDFFTVPAATFRILFAFVVLRHDRRKVVHFNVTAHPTAQWTAQQIVDAFPFDEARRFLLRDRDSIYGHQFKNRINNMGIEEVVTAARSPWQKDHVACCTSLVRFGGTSGNLLRSDSFCVRRDKALIVSGCDSRPATGSLQPVAIGAVTEVTKWLKHSGVEGHLG